MSANKGEGLSRFLRMQAGRNLLKYQMMDRRFQKEYQNIFEQFGAERVGYPMPFKVERDYFDWELVITGMDEVREEIEQLEKFLRLTPVKREI